MEIASKTCEGEPMPIQKFCPKCGNYVEFTGQLKTIKGVTYEIMGCVSCSYQYKVLPISVIIDMMRR